MKKIFEMWQWKLKIVILSLVFLSLPVILNWDNFKAIEIFFIFTGFPILIWLTVTYGLHEYGKEISKEFENEKIKTNKKYRNEI